MSAFKYELRTQRLFLRPLRLSDAVMLWPHVSDPEIPKFMLWNVNEDLKSTRKFLRSSERELQKENGVNWAIFKKKEFCGVIGIEIIKKIQDVGLDRCELGYWLGKEFWGQGIVVEAAQAVISFAFDVLKLHKITTGHFMENIRSQRVIEKLGFRLVGMQKAHFLKDGKWHDHKTYEMLREDFTKLSS